MNLFFVFYLLIFNSFIENKKTDFKYWDKLKSVKFEKSQDEYGEILKPIFSQEIKELEGKIISLPGYILPLEGMFEPQHIIISSLPIESCYFCGGSGGPETVAEVYLKNKIEYTSKLVNITGTLELNNKDVNKLMYIIKNANIKIIN